MDSSLHQEGKARLRMSNPYHLLASGFGSGLSPLMPGTMGSLVALLPGWLLLMVLPLPVFMLLVLLSIVFGVYLCHRTAQDMGVHDHGSIVWDEFVGVWITLMALPEYNWQWVVSGTVLFRILDIWKPWPICWLDRHISGGIGIMADDIVAGLLAAGFILLLSQGIF